MKFKIGDLVRAKWSSSGYAVEDRASLHYRIGRIKSTHVVFPKLLEVEFEESGTFFLFEGELEYVNFDKSFFKNYDIEV